MDREFWVNEGRQQEFETFFAPLSKWATLLGRSKGYVGTEVRCESVIERQYRVRDFWRSHQNFESFRVKFAVDCDDVSEWLFAELIEKQRLVGMYYLLDCGRDEEDGLIRA